MLDDGINSVIEIHYTKTHFYVGRYAELGTFLVLVIDRAGREAYTPPVGKLTAKRHSCTTACLVADNADVGTTSHVLHELIGRAIDTTVRKHDHRFLPTQATARLEPLFPHGRKSIVSLSRLMLNIAHEKLLIGKAGGQLFGTRNQSTAVVADIDD